MKRFTRLTSIASLIGLLGMALGATSADQQTPCFTREFKTTLVWEACSKGGQAEAKDAERNCLEARSNLKQLQEGMRVSRVDPRTGERSFLDDKERPGEIASAQRAVDNWCNKK